MITKAEYEAAVSAKKSAEEIIVEYHRQKADQSEARWKAFLGGAQPYTDDELRYSAGARCHCGAGLAYPKDCPPNHRWDCSDWLKGQARQIVDDATHQLRPHEILPFAFYSVISEEQKERAQGQSTRPKP